MIYFHKIWGGGKCSYGKDSNCVGILSDQGEAATISNLSENTKINSLRVQPRLRLLLKSPFCVFDY